MNTLADLVSAVGAAQGDVDLHIDGRLVRVTNLDRPLWPAAGMTKRDYVRYILAISPVLLPHLHDRAVTMARFPEGVDGPGWYQAECRSRPAWLRTHVVPGRQGTGGFRYCLFDDAASLVWAANLGTLEFHPFNWTVDQPERPLTLILDLDPGEPAGLVECSIVALRLRGELAARGMSSVAKTSGSLGLHLLASPAPGTFEEAKAFARDLAESAADADPNRIVADSSRAARAGRVFIDWLQNDAARSTIAPYSLRATPWPLVSTPVTWAEVEAAAAGDATVLRFGPRDVLDRVALNGDLMEVKEGAAAR
jgi:bifunctional non-homologous end joining protein LigD